MRSKSILGKYWSILHANAFKSLPNAVKLCFRFVQLENVMHHPEIFYFPLVTNGSSRQRSAIHFVLVMLKSSQIAIYLCSRNSWTIFPCSCKSQEHRGTPCRASVHLNTLSVDLLWLTCGFPNTRGQSENCAVAYLKLVGHFFSYLNLYT